MEIGRIDILLETSLLSNNLEMPRIDPIELTLHKFGYLKLHPKKNLSFDMVRSAINENFFRIMTGQSFIGIPVK